ERLDSAAVLDVLDSNKIKYKIDDGTGALLVESSKINEARLKLSEAGVPGDNKAGFELLDKEQPLGTSQFMETARYRRSLEGELARTIASINNVRGARVHLAIPKDSVFVRDMRPASASVFVELFPGSSLQPAQVKSIVNLVASSVPDMKPENVTVVDQKGVLLSQIAMEDPQLAAANKQLEYTHRIEQQLRDRINSILAPVLGPNKFRAEVAADVDFTAVEEAGEQYNPDAPAIRSEQRIEEQRGTGSVGGVPGATSNQPPTDGRAPEQVAGAQANQPGQPQGTGTSLEANGAAGGKTGERAREQIVRNYELDRTLSYTKHQVGKLRRVTVAVAVDNKMAADAKPGDQGAPLDPAELERLAILVRNAVGFDPARGDVVNVVNSPFVPVVEEEGTPAAIPFYQQPWFLSVAKIVGAALVVIALIVFVLRPVMSSLTQNARSSLPMGGGGMGVGDMGDMTTPLGPLGNETVTLSGANANMMLPGPENYDQQLTAIKGLIAEDPGRVAQVVKKWVASDT
ncbi:MAG TPA: flagellar basal-body MS-ring/collar protein FliF, partial [Spongiibacteraceae bacterium]|nr:flagellar basal-body MS-ring/collar protein FliF [Spongiibacteraceae bacterium]